MINLFPTHLQEGLSIHGKEVDWWGFGIVFYELLTGQVPFDGDSEIEIYGQINQFEVCSL